MKISNNKIFQFQTTICFMMRKKIEENYSKYSKSVQFSFFSANSVGVLVENFFAEIRVFLVTLFDEVTQIHAYVSLLKSPQIQSEFLQVRYHSLKMADDSNAIPNRTSPTKTSI